MEVGCALLFVFFVIVVILQALGLPDGCIGPVAIAIIVAGLALLVLGPSIKDKIIENRERRRLEKKHKLNFPPPRPWAQPKNEPAAEKTHKRAETIDVERGEAEHGHHAESQYGAHANGQYDEAQAAQQRKHRRQYGD
jgi:hypothetical protein